MPPLRRVPAVPFTASDVAQAPMSPDPLGPSGPPPPLQRPHLPLGPLPRLPVGPPQLVHDEQHEHDAYGDQQFATGPDEAVAHGAAPQCGVVDHGDAHGAGR